MYTETTHCCTPFQGPSDRLEKFEIWVNDELIIDIYEKRRFNNELNELLDQFELKPEPLPVLDFLCAIGILVLFAFLVFCCIMRSVKKKKKKNKPLDDDSSYFGSVS